VSEAVFLELRTGAGLSSVRVLNEVLGVALRQLGVAEALCHDVTLGVAELVANVHEHEYQGKQGGDVVVRLDLAKDALEVTVESKGPRFDPTAPREAREPDDELEAGGLGLPLLHGLFDRVSHSYDDDRGNRVTLRKVL
jgi:anti-sigma regulatory factor (Ser/Thr protein kinase)